MMKLFSKIKDSSLFRNSFIYIFCDGLNKAIPFLLLPFITHFLTPSDYGVVTNYNVFVQILMVFCYSTTAASLPVMYYKLNQFERKRYVSNMLCLNVAITIFCLCVVVVMSNYIAGFLNFNLIIQVSAIVLVLFSGITNLNMVLWRCEERPVYFGLYQILQSVFKVLMAVVLVIILLLGWRGRICSMFISNVFFGILSLYILLRRDYFNFKLDKLYLSQIVLFSLPLIPHALSFWLKSGVDKILLSNLSGLEANGLYSVAITWGGIVTMFFMAFNNAYAPFLYKKLASFDADKSGNLYMDKVKLVKMIYFSFIVMLFFVLFIYILSFVLIRIIYDSSYYASVIYLPWVMIAQFFYGGYLMFVCFIHYALKTKVLGMITFSLTFIQILLSYLLILKFGSIGVAISSAVVNALIFIFVAIYAMKVYRLPWLFFYYNRI